MRFNDRTGEARTMNNGMTATVVAYRGACDIDVRFDNGGIAHHVRYGNFTRGQIACPMLFEYIEDYVKVTNANVTPTFSFLIDKDAVSLIGDRFWFDNGYGYAQCMVDGKKQLFHRLIMNAPDDMEVDHKYGKTLDCRKSNLRICIHAENGKNQSVRINNTSG